MTFQDAKRRATERAEELETPTFNYGLSLRLSTHDLELTRNNELQTKVETAGAVTATRLTDATEEETRRFNSHFLELYDATTHKLTSHHVATLDDGILVHANGDGTVRLEHALQNGAGSAHVIVIAESGADLRVEEATRGHGDYMSLGVEIFTGPNATVTYESLHNVNAWQFTVKRGRIARDATLNWFTASLGDGVDKTEVSTELRGEGSSVQNYGIYHGRDEQRFDIYNQSSHEAPHTTSDMKNKGVVTDNAKGIYRGLVDIGEVAHDSQGYQTEDALILSDTAEANAVPNLEIRNNEVQCSHGATVGRVDEEQLYYMRTRGLTERQARRAIIRGFLYSMTAHVDSDELRTAIEDEVEERI